MDGGWLPLFVERFRSNYSARRGGFKVVRCSRCRCEVPEALGADCRAPCAPSSLPQHDCIPPHVDHLDFLRWA